MVHSAEVRWFIPTTLPERVQDWFKDGQPSPELEDSRVDEYLLFPDCDSVGVKLREGKLEIKAMLCAPRPISMGAGINGRTDQWVKWSFKSEGLRDLNLGLHQSGKWVKVRKERCLRKFSADANIVEVPAKQKPFPIAGCNVELTRIEVEEDPRFWFSLGFESFGPSGSTSKILDDTLRLFFKKRGLMPGVPLNGLASLSYPAWLATFA